MRKVGRRSVLGGTLGLAAAGTLSRPYIANAQAKTAVCWINQGFIPQEDEAMKKVCEDYMKASGNKLDYSIMPFMALQQKSVSALTSGDVPDLMFGDAPQSILPQNAWDDKMVDVTDVVAPYESQLSETAKLCSTFYNKATKKRSYYLCPIKQGATPFHIWGDLVEKAGFKIEDIPKDWNGVWNYLKQTQAPLRAKGMRKIYACGLQITTVGPNDGNNVFTHFLIANGGEGIITPDGKLHTDDPQVRDAAVKAIVKLTTAFKEGLVPPGCVNWNDADDNNAFHSKLMVMDFDGTISTELALFHKKEEFEDILTHGMPLSNDGKELPSQVALFGPVIPKGAKNVAVAKEFVKYSMQPKVLNEYLKGGLGRWALPIPEIVKSDPFWLHDDPHRTAYVDQSVIKPTMPIYEAYNPAIAQVGAEHVIMNGVFDVMKNGMAPEVAIDKAFKRAETIFAKYPILSS